MATEEKNDKELTSSSQNGDVEEREKKLKYPRAIPFIISNEFCERFNYYGMRTILVLYFTRKLDYSDDTATILYHGFTTLVYFCCVLGAIIADSWWGKFHTILWLSMVYVAGSSVIAIGAIETWNLPATAMTLIGLGLIAFGSGGIKPCVAAFGGEQFTLPQQAKQIGIFFSIFYFAINAGSLISTTVTPILREQHCFGENDCFSLAFGVPAMLMATSILVFVGGKFLYKIIPPQGNMFVKVCKCIGNAISTKRREKTTNPREHWLEYAETQFGKKLVKETRILLNVLVLYLPLPFFWALFDQQGSRWTFQATRMDGDLGFYTVKPDQMQLVNPLLILTFIPLFELIFYPLLSLIGIRRPLQKLTMGGIFAGIAFLCSMFVEITLEKTYPIIPQPGEAQVRIFNGLNCDYKINVNLPTEYSLDLGPNSYFVERHIALKDDKLSSRFTLTSPTCANIDETFELKSEKASSYFLTGTAQAPVVQPYEDDPEKSKKGTPLIRVLANLITGGTVFFRDKDGTHYNQTYDSRNLTDIPSNIHDIYVNDSVVKTHEFRLGGVYTVLIQETASGVYSTDIIVISEPNTMNMLWLLPQYIIMTLGEVMFSVTGLQFSYNQAPESMRSVLQGCWQLTVGFGNLITTIIISASIFKRQTFEFALFAGLMFLDMVFFMWLALRYKPISLEELNEVEDEMLEENEEKKDALDFSGSSKEARID